MGIPSPNYEQLKQAAVKHIVYHKELLSEIKQGEKNQEIIVEVATSLFDQIKDQLQAKESLTCTDIHHMTQQVCDKMDTLFQSYAYKESSSLDQEKCAFILASFKAELKAFEKVVLHKNRLARLGLEGCLNTHWGWEQFEQLTKINDPWAIDILRKQLQEHDPKAVSLLIKNQAFPAIHPLIFEFKDDIYFQEVLQEILTQNDEESQKVYELIELVLIKQDWEWAEQILESQGPLIQDLLWRLFEKEQNPRRWINQFILNQLSQNSFLGIHFYARIFSQESDKAASLITSLVEIVIRKNSITFDMLLIAFTVLSEPKNQLLKIVEPILGNIEQQRGEKNGYYKKILDHLLLKKEELAYYFSKPSSEPSQPNPWKKVADFGIARTYQLFALRQYLLIQFLIGGCHAQEEDFVPMIDCFTKSAAIMVGRDAGVPQFFDEIAAILHQHQVTVYAPITFEEEDKVQKVDHLIPLTSDREVDVWLQDYCYVGLSQNQLCFRFPNWVMYPNFHSIPRQRIKENFPEEYQRFKLDDFKLYALGAVNQWQDQLQLLDYFLRIDPQLSTLSFQFTFNEGGNCLIGEDQEGAFAIIGKDARDLNKIFLKAELAHLGFMKNGKNQWVSSSPNPEKDLDLTDEDLKIFFAKDLGIKKDRIYFIEQPSYHLDMSMSLMGGKTVVLNDSMLAYEQQVKRGSAYLATQGKKEQDRVLFTKRLQELYEKSVRMKFLEDAAEADLKMHGFKVVRQAGLFENLLKHYPEHHQTNLFNYLALTTPEDKKIIIALGSSEEHQEEFREMIKNHCQFKVDHIYFLDRDLSEAFLTDNGGVHCLSKALPSLF